MKRLLLVVAIALLALPASAGAKELTALSVCGTDGCHTTRDRAELRTAMNVVPQADPNEQHRFFRLRLHIGGPGMEEEGIIHSAWIPSLGMLRADDGPYSEYSLPRPRTARMLRRLSAGLHPFPPAKPRESPSARVDEVVLPPSGDGGSDGGGSPWAWSLLAIAPAGIALWMVRRRRGTPKAVGT
jgi:hypothetical protein